MEFYRKGCKTPGERRSDRVSPGFPHTMAPCGGPAAKHQVFSWLSPGRLIGHLADLAFTRKKPGQLGNTSFFGKMSQKRLLFRPLPFDSKPFFVVRSMGNFPPHKPGKNLVFCVRHTMQRQVAKHLVKTRFFAYQKNGTQNTRLNAGVSRP